MAVDTPATIAILGAGPIGLEAALYARFLGYDVQLYDRGAVGHHVRQWGHVRMYTPFAGNCSRLGLAALAAQDPRYRPPAADALLTGGQWLARYLEPLAQTDLLADHLLLQTTALQVTRAAAANRGDEAEAEPPPFHLLVRDRDGSQRTEIADVVIDATGVYGQPDGLGPGGVPAEGEAACASRIEYGLPDFSGRDRGLYARQHTLLVGADPVAAINAVALVELTRQEPGTRVTWVTPAEPEAAAAAPFSPVATTTGWREVAEVVRRCARGAEPAVHVWPQTVVQAVVPAAPADTLVVQLAGQHAGSHTFDRILGNVGFRGLPTLRGALPPAANFHILGAKNFRHPAAFLFADGLQQIRALFARLGGRADLDLYATIRLP